MYDVQWLQTGRRKWVKRLNLFFHGESRPGFRFRLRQARRRKEEVRGTRGFWRLLRLPGLSQALGFLD